jgi:protein-S-isoprenylcysteine O-methyltransferase Ste14
VRTSAVFIYSVSRTAMVLPLAFGALALGLIMTVLWWTVLAYKIRLEDAALDARREG